MMFPRKGGHRGKFAALFLLLQPSMYSTILGPYSVDGCGIGDGTSLEDFKLTICYHGSNLSLLFLGMKEGAARFPLGGC